MRIFHELCVAALSMLVCACEVEETSITEQGGMTLQGMTLQGMTLQGMTLQGMRMHGFRVDGATLGGAALVNLRVERGELVAEQGGATRRGAALVGARLFAEVRDLAVDPPASATVAYRIADVAPELATYDRTQTGSTSLYTLEQWIPERGAWQPACPADGDGHRVAIPIAATWDERGARIESSTLFTLGCTTGVIAKCYRWGYQPWLTGYGEDMAEMHWTCTRLARADYCGNGVSFTQEETWINLWDTLPAPGPIQHHGARPPPGMLFEAGWDTGGAVCLSHPRWRSMKPLIDELCPDRLMPPGLGPLVCNSDLEVPLHAPSVRMFNESYANP